MKKRAAIGFLILGILYALGCGNKPQTTPDPTGQASRTPEPFNTVQVQPTVVVKATNTPTGTPTDTPTPTNTPTDTPSPTPTLTVDEEVLVTERKSADIPFIMLDAGHGGGDPGACADNDKVKESELNLSIVWKVANKLRDLGMQVVMTRNSDKKPSTYDSKAYKKLYPDKKDSQRFNYFRRDLSDKTDVDMFISVHQNSSSQTSAKGCEVWRTKAFNRLSASLAQTVFDGITEKIGYSKYIIGDASKDSPAKNLIVLQTNKPSILIECGYLTNAEELKLLVTDEFQEKIANGIVQGIIAYYKEQGMYPDFNFGE